MSFYVYLVPASTYAPGQKIHGVWAFGSSSGGGLRRFEITEDSGLRLMDSDPPADQHLGAINDLTAELTEAQRTATNQLGYVLNAIITGTPTDGGPPVVISRSLRCVQVSSGGVTWAWTPPAPPQATWKVPFVVGGQLTAGFAGVSVEVDLQRSERLQDPSGLLLPGTTSPRTIETQRLDVTAHSTATVTFMPITEQWPWVTPAIWTRDGPISKVIVYTTRIRVRDEFGNAYPDVVSPSLEVEVDVTWQKVTAQLAALTAFASSVALGVAALYWPPLWAASAAAFATATALGSIAMDPPDPDSSFSEVVAISFPAKPWMAKSTGLESTAMVFNTIQRLCAYREAMFRVEAKVLGARKAQSRSGERKQLRAYAKLGDQLLREALTLAGIADAADEELRDHVDRGQLRSALEAWNAGEMSQRVFEAAPRNMRGKKIAQLDRAVRDKEVFELARRVSLTDVAHAALTFAASVQEDGLMQPPVRG